MDGIDPYAPILSDEYETDMTIEEYALFLAVRIGISCAVVGFVAGIFLSELRTFLPIVPGR